MVTARTLSPGAHSTVGVRELILLRQGVIVRKMPSTRRDEGEGGSICRSRGILPRLRVYLRGSWHELNTQQGKDLPPFTCTGVKHERPWEGRNPLHKHTRGKRWPSKMKPWQRLHCLLLKPNSQQPVVKHRTHSTYDCLYIFPLARPRQISATGTEPLGIRWEDVYYNGRTDRQKVLSSLHTDNKMAAIQGLL